MLCTATVTTAFSADTPGVLHLSLEDALSAALKENKSLQYSRLNKDISDYTVALKRSIFIPEVQSSYSYSQNNTDNNLNGHSGAKTDELLVSLSQANMIGGTASVNFSTARDANSFINGPDVSEYTSSVFLNYSQPVLKGFGREITNLEINKAVIDRDTANEAYEDTKANILFNVFREYFLLYSVSEELRLSVEIRKNTEEIYKMVDEKVKAQKLPITELNTLKAALLSQDKQLLDLASAKTKQQDRLMLAIYEEPKRAAVSEVVPATMPETVISGFTEPSIVESRTKIEDADIDLIQFNNDLKKLEKDRLKAVSGLKPDLSVSLEAGYDGNDLNNRRDSIGNISSSNYRALITGTLLFPVINRAARSDVLTTESRMEQARIQIMNRKGVIENTVDELFDDFQTVKMKMGLDREIVGISKNNLDNEIERLIGEKSTALNTLDYQTTYISAQIDMVRTLVDYMLLIGTYHLYTREIEQLVNKLQ